MRRTHSVPWSRPRRVLALGVLALSPFAATAAAPLTAEAVLASSASHYPTIIEAMAATRSARAGALEADGAFDLVFKADGFNRATGFYDGTALSGTVIQPLRAFGAQLYSEYKLSDGDFPIYEDESFANGAGTAKVGVLFSLLRDRDIDDERFAQRAARLDMEAAELTLLLTRVGVQQQALAAYWQWVAKGQELRIYQDLLTIATRRQAGFETQVRQGALAEIFLTENQQNITRRTRFVALARRNLALAANTLSLYHRDGGGRPLAPTLAQLPTRLAVDAARLANLDGAAVESALDRRPELSLLRTAIAREQARITLQRNGLQPALDIGLEVRAGLGAEAEGGPSRDSTDTIVGFTFSVPLQRREARGALARSLAELEQYEARQRHQQERITAEVRNLLVELQVAAELVELAEQEVEQSEAMRAAEQQRFQSGASDFFLVNVREETAADARIKRNTARLQLQLTRAKVDAATVDLQRLGLR